MPSVLVPIARGFEELEAVTVMDLLRRAGIEVITAGLEPGPVQASRGLVMLPDAVLDDVVGSAFDMIVLPGGREGADRLRQDPRVLELLRRQVAGDRFVAAICAAPHVLADAGLLQGRRATGYPGVLDELDIPGLQPVSEAVVVEGKMVTSRGPGTAMDFALRLIQLLVGKTKRDAVEAALVREPRDGASVLE